MNDHSLQLNPRRKEKTAISKIVKRGFWLRIAVMFFIFAVSNGVTLYPYFLADDIKYELTAKYYLVYANGPFDFAYLEDLVDGYYQPFWPTVMCLSAGIFRSIYIGRYLNILMSATCIKVIYDIVLLLTGKEKSALLAGKLFAYMPITVLTSCFPIKDIFLTLSVTYTFYIFLLFHSKQKVPWYKLLACIAGLVGTYFTRGAVVELMSIFMFIYLFDGCLRKKQYVGAAGIVLLAVLSLILFKDYLFDAFETKVDDYSGYNEKSDGLAILQMQSIAEFYKMPFAYIFATLQPMALNLFGKSSGNLWLRVIYLSNITIYPVAIANTLYIFQKKHNPIFWLSGVIIFCAVISMSLGIFRHYLFLMPLEMINCALYIDRTEGQDRSILAFGSGAILFVVLAYSFVLSI